MPVAGYLAYAGARVPPVGAIGYGVAAAVVIGVATWRHLRATLWGRLNTHNDLPRADRN